MGVKMGRPKIDNPKNDCIKIRATKEDKEKLLYCCEKLKCTQYDFIMENVNKVYKKIKKEQ